ncbi:MAG: hypothetical protein L6R40_001903 [Gallowayella cf. fulva]|nr:MAG: hypothetical protein L6R40_001903 [Xanthomendoza cf. fulva]
MPVQSTNHGTERLLPDHQLFYLAFLRIYVSTSYRTVASHLNRYFELQPPLTAAECSTLYLELHDTEHERWMRARDMNRQETELLKTMMQDLGLTKKRWDVDLIQPVGSATCYRVAGRSVAPSSTPVTRGEDGRKQPDSLPQIEASDFRATIALPAICILVGAGSKVKFIDGE